MKNKHFTHRRLIMIIDVIGVQEHQQTKLDHIRTSLQTKHKKWYSFGIGRIIERAINGGTRVYIFELYTAKNLHIVQKYKHYAFRFFTTALRHIGINPKPLIVTHYA